MAMGAAVLSCLKLHSELGFYEGFSIDHVFLLFVLRKDLAIVNSAR